MADTSFTAQQTTIVAAWLNQVNLSVFQGRSPNMGTTTGSANAQVLTLATGSLYTGEANGDTFGFIAGYTNSGAATLQIVAPSGTLTASPLRFNGAALTGGEIIAGQPYVVMRMGGAYWEIVSLAGTAFATTILQAANAAAARAVIGAGTSSLTSPLTTKGDLWGYTSTDARVAAGTDYFELRALASATAGVTYLASATAIASGRNIASQTNSGTPASQFDITADELVVKTTSGGAVVLSSVNVTINLAASGANGLDTGSEASNTWYYGWVIAKADGTVAGLASISATAPTMPADYIFKALVTAVRNDGSSNLLPYRQAGNFAFFTAQQSVLSAGAATTSTSVSLSSFVPPIAERVQLLGQNTITTNAGAGSNTSTIEIITGSTFSQLRCQDSFAAATDFDTQTVLIPNLSQAVFYLNTTGGSVTTATLSLWVLGFSLPCGGQ